MPRWTVLVNRSAGRKAADPAFVEGVVRAIGLDCEVVAPTSQTEMAEAVREAAIRGVRHFAVAGGDGTVNTLVNALLPLGIDAKPTLGVLPTGTGCDLLRTFGIPQDMIGAARHLQGEDSYEIDVALLTGEWGVHYYVNVAQAGVGAAAAQTAPKMSRRLGSVRYPLAFAARLPGFPQTRVKIKTERREIESEALAVIFANAQFFAGGWNVAPRATLMDGVLDLQIFNARKAEAPALVPKIIKGTHLGDARVRRVSVSEFSLETEAEWPIEADGDLIGNTPVSGKVIPAAINLKI